jgi:hypothetical protein
MIKSIVFTIESINKTELYTKLKAEVLKLNFNKKKELPQPMII